MSQDKQGFLLPCIVRINLGQLGRIQTMEATEGKYNLDWTYDKIH